MFFKKSKSNLKCTLPVLAHKKSRYYALFQARNQGGAFGAFAPRNFQIIV